MWSLKQTVNYRGFPRHLTAAGVLKTSAVNCRRFLKTSVANCRGAFWYFTRVAQPNYMWEQQFSMLYATKNSPHVLMSTDVKTHSVYLSLQIFSVLM
ncbi:hypothetical protein MTR_0014s0140 [Medicago truncatula]|uniref:Uncharacterized protein n=1 Tax=Medicago truncatula TaxID=3880 RepID=A0A072TJW4_MEDTR|nr:hypothetical protein MTR_0014s0140 [Medicago truncatula]